MSGVNIACSIGNQLGNGGGEMKFEVTPKETSNLATCIANEIVNEILENALDIAAMGNRTGLDCDTIAFSVDEGMCRFATNDSYRCKSNMDDTFINLESDNYDNYTEEINDECPDIKEIIEGLSSIHVPNQNAEEPLRLDIEMKRLLSEMMSPPYDIVNYETLPRKDGVGDQPVEDPPSRDDDETGVPLSDESLVDPDKNKIVEKKTRVTDLVMNSKQVLSEYLMTEELRKQQEEWEESNERVIQVIDLDVSHSDDEHTVIQTEHLPEHVELACDDVESVTAMPDEEVSTFAPMPKDDCMDSIDLNSVAAKGRKGSKEKVVGGGDDTIQECLAGSSHTQNPEVLVDTVVSNDNKEIKGKGKFEIFKKKKWNINFKFLGFKKRKQSQDLPEKTNL